MFCELPVDTQRKSEDENRIAYFDFVSNREVAENVSLNDSGRCTLRGIYCVSGKDSITEVDIPVVRDKADDAFRLNKEQEGNKQQREDR